MSPRKRPLLHTSEAGKACSPMRKTSARFTCTCVVDEVGAAAPRMHEMYMPSCTSLSAVTHTHTQYPAP